MSLRRIWRRIETCLSSPRLYLLFHGWAAVFWTIMIVPSWLWFRNSLFFVIFISLYANIATEFGAWQAVRAEIQALKATIEASEAAMHAERLRTEAMHTAIQQGLDDRRRDRGGDPSDGEEPTAH
jgi:hypothetical protein